MRPPPPPGTAARGRPRALRQPLRISRCPPGSARGRRGSASTPCPHAGGSRTGCCRRRRQIACYRPVPPYGNTIATDSRYRGSIVRKLAIAIVCSIVTIHDTAHDTAACGRRDTARCARGASTACAWSLHDALRLRAALISHQQPQAQKFGVLTRKPGSSTGARRPSTGARRRPQAVDGGGRRPSTAVDGGGRLGCPGDPHFIFLSLGDAAGDCGACSGSGAARARESRISPYIRTPRADRRVSAAHAAGAARARPAAAAGRHCWCAPSATTSTSLDLTLTSWAPSPTSRRPRHVVACATRARACARSRTRGGPRKPASWGLHSSSA